MSELLILKSLFIVDVCYINAFETFHEKYITLAYILNVGDSTP